MQVRRGFRRHRDRIDARAGHFVGHDEVVEIAGFAHPGRRGRRRQPDSGAAVGQHAREPVPLAAARRRHQRHRDQAGGERAEERERVVQVLAREDRDALPRLGDAAQRAGHHAHPRGELGPRQRVLRAGAVVLVGEQRALVGRTREEALDDRGAQHLFGHVHRRLGRTGRIRATYRAPPPGQAVPEQDRSTGRPACSGSA